MRDGEIEARIKELVEREHELRGGDGPVDDDEVHRLEQTLDQCWDLLRQRRARRDVGADPDAAGSRPTGTVEGYRQ